MNEPEKKEETYEEKIERIYDYDPSIEEVKTHYSEEFIKKWLG